MILCQRSRPEAPGTHYLNSHNRARGQRPAQPHRPQAHKGQRAPSAPQGQHKAGDPNRASQKARTSPPRLKSPAIESPAMTGAVPSRRESRICLFETPDSERQRRIKPD